MRIRMLIAGAGLLLGLFGVFRLLTQVRIGDLAILGLWIAGALLIHDGVLSPAVVAVGWVIEHTVPARARRHLQAALVVGALITVVASPMIYRQGSGPVSKALLQQNYARNLTVLLAVIASFTLGAYALRVLHDHPGQQAAAEDVGDPRPSGT